MSYSKSDFDALPELPVEALCRGADLKPDPVEPVIRNIPRRLAPREPSAPPDTSAPTPLCQATASSRNTRYHVICTYPRVICHPPEILGEGQIARAVEANANADRDQDGRGDTRRFFRLSRLEGLTTTLPHFCTVHSGPWTGIVTERQQCSPNCRRPPNLWDMTVSGIPEIFISWEGTWDDAPFEQVPNLQVLKATLTEVASSEHCCPGFVFCPSLGACAPERVCCGGPDCGCPESPV